AAPTASRIHPTVWSSTPLTVTFTAQTRMAPAATSRRLIPIPIGLLLLSWFLQGKRAASLFRYAGARARGAARPPLPADPGSGAHRPRRSRGVDRRDRKSVV